MHTVAYYDPNNILIVLRRFFVVPSSNVGVAVVLLESGLELLFSNGFFNKKNFFFVGGGGGGLVLGESFREEDDNNCFGDFENCCCDLNVGDLTTILPELSGAVGGGRGGGLSFGTLNNARDVDVFDVETSVITLFNKFCN